VLGLDDDGALERARARAATFDAMILDVVQGIYRSNHSAHFDPDSMARTDPRVRWDIEQLIDDYIEYQAYPLDRLAGGIDRAIDLKLEHHFIRTTFELDNGILRSPGFDPRNPLAHPRQHLDRLYMLQNLIGQIRILWERAMTLIYYLEKGKDPDGKKIRKVFFDHLSAWSPRWDVFEGWHPVITKHDGDYRTPEFHIGSKIRKELFGGATTDRNDLTALYTPLLSGFWNVLSANVRGEPPPSTRLGRNASRGPERRPKVDCGP